MDGLLPVAVAAAAVALAALWWFVGNGPKTPEPEPAPAPAPAKAEPQKKKQPKEKPVKVKAGKAHPLNIYSSKAHNGSITSVSFSRNGKVLATSGTDRQIKLFTGFDGGGGGGIQQQTVKVISQTSGGMDFPDSVCCAAIGSKNSYLVVATDSNSLRGYYLPDIVGDQAVGLAASTRTVEKLEAHDVAKTIQSVAVAPRGNFVVSCTNETEIRLFTFPLTNDGPVETINTNQTKNHQLKLSPDGKYFACATQSSEVKIWQVNLGASRTGGMNDGPPTGATKVALLTGHKRCVWS
jgi:WD40 repeat protein